jgi:hypothetical protein
MIRQLALILFLVTLPVAVQAAEDPCGNYYDTWTVCTKASDCVIGATQCGGANTGVYNRASVAEANRYAFCKAPTINCLLAPPAHDPGEPLICNNGRCDFAASLAR